jgi:tetratricopeptide (TPR) repeat protein
MNVLDIILGLVFLLLIFISILLIRKISSKENKHIAILSIILVFVAVIFGFLLSRFFSERVSSDYISLNQPYLEAKMVVQELSNGEFEGLFNILNIGNLPVKDVYFDIESEYSLNYEILPEYKPKRTLGPRNEMTYYPPPFTLDYIFKDSISIYFKLSAYYTSVIQNQEFHLKTTFTFDISAKNFKAGIYNYNYKNTLEEKRITDIFLLDSLRTSKELEIPVGSYTLTFKPSQKQSSRFSLINKSLTKELLFDDIEKNVIFNISISDTINLSLFNKISEPDTGWHYITITWDIQKPEFSLFVDGVFSKITAGDYYFLNGNYYFSIKQYKKAIISLENAIKIDTTDLSFKYDLLFKSYVMLGDEKKGIMILKRAVENNILDPIFFHNISLYYEQSDNVDSALVWYERGVTSITDELLFTNYLRLLINRSNFSKAHKVFNIAVSKFPESSMILNNGGAILFNEKNFLEAKKLFVKAIKLDSSNVNAQRNLERVKIILSEKKNI